LAEKEEAALLGIYEQVFDHQSFTGRSGTFYKYEGLGCIYWHMVSKLVLAVSELLEHASESGADAATLTQLKRHYTELREGIGVHKTPAAYGAIPTDPYSHTPGFAGVQQPGMTGQVKEDLISRASEMGMAIEEGHLEFLTALVTESEFLGEQKTFHYFGVGGAEETISYGPNLSPVLRGIFCGHPSVREKTADRSWIRRIRKLAGFQNRSSARRGHKQPGSSRSSCSLAFYGLVREFLQLSSILPCAFVRFQSSRLPKTWRVRSLT